MDPKEAQQYISENLEWGSKLIAVVGMNSYKIADNLADSKMNDMAENDLWLHHSRRTQPYSKMDKTVVEKAENDGESPEVFLNRMLVHSLQKIQHRCDRWNDDVVFDRRCGETSLKLQNIHRALAPEEDYDSSNLLSVTERRFEVQNNFNDAIDGLKRFYSAKDFLILMKVSYNTELSRQALKKLRAFAENPDIKIVLFLEMTPQYYNEISTKNALDGFFDMTIYCDE